MRVSIHKLQFLRPAIEITDQNPGASIKYAVWKDAINHFLKTGNRNAAISYLNTRFNRFAEHRFDMIDRMHYLKELNSCIDDYESLNLGSILRKENFEFSIGNGIMVYGQVPRVDRGLNNHNFYICFYINEDVDWKNDIKYPLIQSWFADSILKTDRSKVYVGVYNIENKSHEFISYDSIEINKSWQEAEQLSDGLVKISGNKSRSRQSKEDYRQLLESLVNKPQNKF